MSKLFKDQRLIKTILMSLVLGLLLTFVSGFYNRVSLREHCSSDPKLDAFIDCSLKTQNRGLPLAYKVTDIPEDKIKPSYFIIDLVTWSLVIYLIASLRKNKHG